MKAKDSLSPTMKASYEPFGSLDDFIEELKKDLQGEINSDYLVTFGIFDYNEISREYKSSSLEPPVTIDYDKICNYQLDKTYDIDLITYKGVQIDPNLYDIFQNL